MIQIVTPFILTILNRIGLKKRIPALKLIMILEKIPSSIRIPYYFWNTGFLLFKFLAQDVDFRIIFSSPSIPYIIRKIKKINFVQTSIFCASKHFVNSTTHARERFSSLFDYFLLHRSQNHDRILVRFCYFKNLFWK